MKTQINFLNTTKYKFRYLKTFELILNTVEKEEKFKKPLTLDLTLIDDVQMRQYYLEYKGKDKTTDILSFPFTNSFSTSFLKQKFLGEILISYQKVQQQAKEYRHSITREFCYLFTHGIYHLLGFDHMTKEEENIMNQKVDKIMKLLQIER
ncbi:rRNA maturation RNase YbeY [Mycoplasma sp. 1654_15]|uniref:rRNA maturation RNase YbeY n=1 Tax=Mycoplasma sp. 1654_15 TaxID=2725994 RepID=UPI001449A0B7|nr:rRNA maturation RNase YbeY [Mycoplasma sp. 1654_15]QJB71284.1 rRNA maturation RNase YbeY [Mycoplasma sp. 1654_15]